VSADGNIKNGQGNIAILKVVYANPEEVLIAVRFW